ncbi:MAG: PHP domain-containing protein, partial [Kiritimatiellia bacterium]|nr:PHP domain-containing protein [Kiritimatiellia bacterium]
MNPSYPNPDPLAPWAPLLDAPESASRREARENPDTRRAARPTVVPPADGWVNLHAHTTYSFNAYGFTPTGFAWRARRAGLAAAGIVDFDVLDGADEFLEAGRAFGLKAMVGLETRVFVPEFSSRVLNSPGEPGIAYHMGVGFCR